MKFLADAWAARTSRERWMLVIAAAMIVGLTGWYGPWRAMGAARDAAARRLVLEQTKLENARDLARRVEEVKSWRGDLQADVEASAAVAGLGIDSRRADGADNLTVWISRAEPGVFFSWIRTLYERSGISVTAFEAQALDDGRIALRATLTRGVARNKPPN